MLHTSAFSLGSLAAAWLMKQENASASESSAPVKPELEQKTYDLHPKQPDHPAKARAMISMFMLGGPSQIDILDMT